MELRFQAGGGSAWTAGAVVVFLFEGETLDSACPELSEGAPWLLIAPGLRDFRGKKDEQALLYGPPSMPLSRALVLGLGKKGAGTFAERLEGLRKAAGAAAVRCRELGIETLGIPVTSLARFCEAGPDVERIIEEVVCGALLGLYRNRVFKSAVKKSEAAEGTGDVAPDPRWLGLLFCDATVPDGPRLAARRGETHAEAVLLARKLANTPANHLTPERLADEASKLARRHDMRCEILDRADIEGLGMGAFAAVAAGSINDPRLIVLEHAPAGHAEDAPLVVVGKGITFDSGGISLKPAAGMWEMKSDMGGAAAVLGLFEALGQLETPRRVIGLLACAENMPDARATRPGDVVTTLSGKTVEIVNTDAEGRLVLCDTLTYALQRWTPDMLVDVATLTGACVVALGNDVAGLFCQDATLAQRIKDHGECVGEPFWPLPLWDRYFENLKSETADFANAGAREGGACAAAVFLKQFVPPEIHWAHLDIAGPGFVTRKITNCPAGATGFAVRTLIELVS
ncbi:MAG: leucyl aminopeptidase [Bilophila sp.]